MSRGYPVEQWVEWIEQQRASGLSVAAFCDSIGVSQNAFYVRRRQLAEQLSEVPSFVSLELSGNTASALVEIELPCGAIVRVSDPNAIHSVVTVLMEHGAEQ